MVSLGSTQGNIRRRKNKYIKPTDYKPNGNFPSGEAAQMPAPATSKRGLDREARAAVLFKNQARMPRM